MGSSDLDGVYPTADRHPKILLFDIETTNLKADFGRMLCFAYQWYGERTIHLETIRDTKAFKRSRPWEDGELVKRLYDVLIQADSAVYHFGDRFDLKFFKTRLLELGLSFPNIHTVDTWKVAKRHLLLQSNRMSNIADFLGGEQKSGISKREWVKSNGYHEPSLKKLEAYCKQDIRTLLGIYEKLKPYCKVINHNLFYSGNGCPKCGSKMIVKNGHRYTANAAVQRMTCQSCGTWFDATELILVSGGKVVGKLPLKKKGKKHGKAVVHGRGKNGNKAR